MAPDERDAAMRHLAGQISETCAAQDMGVAIGAACLYIVVQTGQTDNHDFRRAVAHKLRHVADILDPNEPI